MTPSAPHRGAEPGDRQQVEHRGRRGAVAVGQLVEHRLRLVVVLDRGDLAVGLHAQPLAGHVVVRQVRVDRQVDPDLDRLDRRRPRR